MSLPDDTDVSAWATPGGYQPAPQNRDRSSLPLPPVPLVPQSQTVPQSRSRRAGLLVAGAAATTALGVGGFLAASAFHDASGSTSATQNVGAVVPNGQRHSDGQGPAGGLDSSRMTAGRITAISGSTLTLQSFDGGSVTVTTTSTTTMPRDGALGVGQLVFVTGTRTGDTTFAASRISTRPAFDPDGVHGGPGPAGQPGSSNQPGSSGQPGADDGVTT